MENFDRKRHWEKIYQTKDLKDVSWYQPIPSTSLDFIKQFHLPLSAKIIDIGGGDSFLVDNLLELGYIDITVLDISAASLEKTKARLGLLATKIKWIVSDITLFKPTEQYDLWHDRAAFHFLTEEKEIECYINTVQQSIKPSGILVLGTFSEDGPVKCSGLKIKQYSEKTMTNRFSKYFEKINCITVDHLTPFETRQNFIFCSFKRIQPL